MVVGSRDRILRPVQAVVNASNLPLPRVLRLSARPLRISKAGAIGLASILVAMIGFFDYVAGDFSLTVFYLGPLALATWFAGRTSGWFIGIFSAAAWLVGDLALNHAYGHAAMPYWNALMLILVYGLGVHLLSALKDIQAMLQKRFEQRTVSLAEVHHRVKNNLQVISSLLMLQAEKLTNPEEKAVFGECRDRIHSMARLHERLCASGGFEEVDFAAHLREMAEMLFRAHTPPGCDLTLELRVHAVSADLDTSVTLGLIANELILNALKHAFVGRERGILTVSLQGGDRPRMTIRDDGRGLAPGFTATNNGRLGLELVLGMVAQIQGEARIENDPEGGTRAMIFFPPSPLEKEIPINQDSPTQYA